MKILLLDDEQECLNSLMNAVTPLNYSVTTETNPLRAFELIKKNNFDIVVTDMKMPHMSGLTLLKKIKKMDHHTKIIIISAYQDVNMVMETVNNHAYAFFSKPIEVDKFIEKLQEIEIEMDQLDDITLEYKRLLKDYGVIKKAYLKTCDELRNVKKFGLPE